MFNLYRWTLAAFLVLCSLPAPSRAEDDPFSFDLHVRLGTAEITSARHIRLRFHNNRQTRQVRFYVWHEHQRQVVRLDPPQRGPLEVVYQPTRTGKYIVKVQVSDREKGWLVKETSFQVVPRDGLMKTCLMLSNETGYYRHDLHLSILANKPLARRKVTFLYFDKAGNGWKKIPNPDNKPSIKWRAPKPGEYTLRADVSSPGPGYHSSKVDFTAQSWEDYLKPPVATGTVRMTGHPDLPFPNSRTDLPPQSPIWIDKLAGKIWQPRDIIVRLKRRELDPVNGRVTLLVRHQRDDKWTTLSPNFHWKSSRKLWTPIRPGRWTLRLDVVYKDGREKRYTQDFIARP